MPSELNDYATYQLPWRDTMGSCVRFDKKLYLACFIKEYEDFLQDGMNLFRAG